MGKTFKGGEGRPPFDRGTDKRILRLDDLGGFFPHSSQPVKSPDNEGGKPPEPISALPDYSGNETPPVIPVPEPEKTPEPTFDVSSYESYKAKASSYFKDYDKFIKANWEKLNATEQKNYREQSETIRSLSKISPLSDGEATNLKNKLDSILGAYAAIEVRVKKLKEVVATPVTSPVVDTKIPEVIDEPKVEVESPVNQNQDQQSAGGDNTTESKTDLGDNGVMSQEKFNSGYTPMNMVEFKPNAADEIKSEPKADNTDKPRLNIHESGNTTTYNKSFDADILRGSLGNEAQYSATVNLEELAKYAPPTEKVEVVENPATNPEGTKQLTIEEQIALAQEHLNKLLASRGLKSGTEPTDKVENSDVVKETEPDKSKAVETRTFDTNSLSAQKLREANPDITDEQIKSELARRHESFKELLKHRKELKDTFSPYRHSKSEYSEAYKKQISDRYTEYKNTGWLGKMFGFNPKNLNYYGTDARLKYADSRVAYREKLEGVLRSRLGADNALDGQFFNPDKLRAAMTDRFLLRPAKETLKIQNEMFPEANRKNIINKFKNAIRENPKLAGAIGLTVVAGTLATGGLAAAIPMGFGAIGAGVGGLLSTKFGINRSERALETAMKNAQLGDNADSLVEAEIKLLKANQNVEISKNRRDVYAVAGGVIGGGVVGGAFTADYLNNGSESILGRLYDSFTNTSPIEDPTQVAPDITAPEIKTPTTEGPRIILPDANTPPDAATTIPSPSTPDATPAPSTEAPKIEIPNEPGQSDLDTPKKFEPIPDTDQEMNDIEPEEEYSDEDDPTQTGPEVMRKYNVEPGDNYWDIMEGQTSAPELRTMEWMKINQPEHYQELIKLVENYANEDTELRTLLGFGETMDNLQDTSQVNLDLLDYTAREIAEYNGWMDHNTLETPDVPSDTREIISNKVKTIKV